MHALTLTSNFPEVEAALLMIRGSGLPTIVAANFFVEARRTATRKSFAVDGERACQSRLAGSRKIVLPLSNTHFFARFAGPEFRIKFAG